MNEEALDKMIAWFAEGQSLCRQLVALSLFCSLPFYAAQVDKGIPSTIKQNLNEGVSTP